MESDSESIESMETDNQTVSMEFLDFSFDCKFCMCEKILQIRGM